MSLQRNITLNGGGPWGFRLVGGFDFHSSLAISKVTPGGKAEGAGLKPGDIILTINNNDTSNLTHLDAQNQIKSTKTTLSLTVESPTTQPPGNSISINKPATPVQNSKPHAPKPTIFRPTVNATKTWQPIRPKPPPPPITTTTVPSPPVTVNSQDHIPLPSVRKESTGKITTNKSTKQDDFPPPPVTSPPPSSTSQQNAQNAKPPELICEGCKKQIKGPYLTAQGKNWHPDEFVCSSPSCRRPLQNCGFIEEKGQRYCADCYEKYFAHTCGKCHKKIVGEVMHALDQTWHVQCFVCTACKQPFRDGVFHLEHDKPYCVTDYNQMFSTKCKKCGYPIEAGDHYVEALKSQWHESCFTCTVCHCDLKTTGFYAINDSPVCSNHKNARLPAKK